MVGSSPLDIGILVLLGLLTLKGYSRGFVLELSGLVGLVGGILVAAHFHKALADKLSPWITNPDYSRGAAFFISWFAANWFIRMVFSSFRQFLYYLYLGAFDRLMGGLLALAKGVLLMGLFLMFAGNVIFQDSDLLSDSRIAPHMMEFTRQAMALLPMDIKRHLDAYL